MKTKLMSVIMIALVSSGFIIGCTEKDTALKDTQIVSESQNENGKIDNSSDQSTDSKDVVAIDNLKSFGAKAAKEDTDLTKEDMLTYAMEDEYLARKEYEIIINKYGEQTPFSNIIKAEEQHISMLTELFNKYTIPIPEDKSKDYVVIPNSLNESYNTGVKAEVENIDMYERFLNQDIPQDIKDTFIELKDASEKHLSAFEKNASKKKSK